VRLRDDRRRTPLPRPARRARRARWLRVLNEVGFLSRFIPDWARIVGLMQFDTYHVFTVDEHTIEAIGVLGQLHARAAREVAPVASELIGQFSRGARCTSRCCCTT
jgi:[protein-PII] uridylyltransferase